MDCGHYLCGLYNLDGQLRRLEYLDGRVLMPGLRLAIGHQHPTVYVPPEPLREECTRDHIYVTEAHAEVLKAAKFLVFPIWFNGPEHWAVFVLDKAQKTALFFDSMEAGRAERSRRGYQLVKWVVEYAEQGGLTTDFHIHQMPVRQQFQAICGLIVLESVRVFFQGLNGNQSTTLDSPSRHPAQAQVWNENPIYKTMEIHQAENQMLNMWLSAIQRELGSPPAVDIRSPPAPLISWDSAESVGCDDVINTVPNMTWAPPTSATPLDPSDDQPEQLPADLSDLEEEIRYFSVIYDQSTRLAWRLRQRLEFLKDPQSDRLDKAFFAEHQDLLSDMEHDRSAIKFLELLSNAMVRWLAEVKRQYRDTYGQDDYWYHRNYRLISSPRDGVLVSKALVIRLRDYQQRWTAEFDREGGKPDALVVPDLTKDDLVKFLRLCPLLTPETSRGKSEHYGTRYGHTPRAVYSATWLMRNIGTRFVLNNRFLETALFKDNRRVQIRSGSLAAQISQNDLGPGCCDDAWDRLKPTRSADTPSQPGYFSVVPDLMRAIHCMKTQAWYSWDDVWIATSIVSPRFLIPLLQHEEKVHDPRWRHRTLIFGISPPETDAVRKIWTSISDAQRLMLQQKVRPARLTTRGQDYAINTSLTDSDDLDGGSEDDEAGVNILQRKKPGKMVHPPSKAQLDKRSRQNTVFERSARDALRDHQHLAEPLWAAYTGTCRYSQRQALDVMAIIHRWDKHQMPIDAQAGSNKVTVEDLASVLPGRQITVTVMYKAISQLLLLRDGVDIISPRALALYLANPKDMEKTLAIANFFRPINSCLVPGVVYVLAPDDKHCKVLAVCSTTSSYCSTLLFGPKTLTAHLKQTLSDLFASFVDELPAKERWWGTEGGWAWDRFVEIEPECRPDDLGPEIFRVAWESAGSSSRSLGKFLGFDYISQEEERRDTLLDWRYRVLRSCGSAFADDNRGTRRQKVKDVDSTGNPDVHIESTSEEELGPGEQPQDAQSTHEADTRSFSLQAAFLEMENVDLDDKADIEQRIAEALTPTERSRLLFTQQDEDEIMAALEVSANQSSELIPSTIGCPTNFPLQLSTINRSHHIASLLRDTGVFTQRLLRTSRDILWVLCALMIAQ